MRWAVCMKNLEIGKMVLITPDMSVDVDDPRYDQDVHIVPVEEDPNDPCYLSFGVHDFVRNCVCHPKIQERCGGRTIISHQAAVGGRWSGILGGSNAMGNVESNYQKVRSSVHVEFRVRVSDLKNATRQLTVNQGHYKKTDFADVLVSECIATFRTVGTSTEVPVNGIQPGTARLPIHTLEKIAAVARTFKSKETLVLIWDGLIKIGSWQTRNSEIVLGVVPDPSLDMPSDATFLDTLALAAFLSPAGIKAQGIERRVVKAQMAKEDAIDRATRALEPLRVEREKIAALVEDHITEAGRRLRSSLLK